MANAACAERRPRHALVSPEAVLGHFDRVSGRVLEVPRPY